MSSSWFPKSSCRLPPAAATLSHSDCTFWISYCLLVCAFFHSYASPYVPQFCMASLKILRFKTQLMLRTPNEMNLLFPASWWKLCVVHWSSCGGQQQPHTYLSVPAEKKKKRLGRWRVEEKKIEGATPVYNHIMESKWSNTIRKRILFTGFTLCVVLGECWSPAWVKLPFVNVWIWVHYFRWELRLAG